jgi:hypothetical protein
MYMYDNVSLNFSLNEMLQTKVVAGIKTHILCSLPLFPENYADYEIMWNNVVAPAHHRDNIGRCMWFTC